MASQINNTNYNAPLNTDDNIDDDGVVDGTEVRKGDAETGATIGGIGGATVGAIAGAAAGPVGALAGAVIGGIAGALGSGAAVSAVDRIDNDGSEPGDTVNRGTAYDLDADDRTVYDANGRVVPGNGVPGVQTGGYHADGTPDTRGIMEKTADAVTGDRIDDKTGKPVAGSGGMYNTGTSSTMYDADGRVIPGNGVPGVQTGGRDIDGSPDTRGVWEKTADAVTGDRIDDKTGTPVAGTYSNAGVYNTSTGTVYNNDVDGNVGVNRREELGETMPSIKTGGYANDGTPDTRGVGEKVVDAVTGDDIDDKTGRRVDHP